MKLPTDVDENLGFDAAVAALGLKANVSEADHPLLCEGTRRQRYIHKKNTYLLVLLRDSSEVIANDDYFSGENWLLLFWFTTRMNRRR